MFVCSGNQNSALSCLLTGVNQKVFKCRWCLEACMGAGMSDRGWFVSLAELYVYPAASGFLGSSRKYYP